MRTVFADAGFWIALLYTSDDLHLRAQRAILQLHEVRILTTEMVLVEVFSHASKLGSRNRQAAWDLLQRLEQDDRMEIIPQTTDQFRAAAERYADRLDKHWSLTDCASFLTMEARGIQEALAYDSDFVQAGFTALLRDSG